MVYLANTDNKTGIVHLYDSDGSLMHINENYNNQGVFINDIEIATDRGHDAYYIGGYRQAHPVLQIAYIRAFEISTTKTSKWRLWFPNIRMDS